jgi:hypothetical protein
MCFPRRAVCVLLLLALPGCALPLRRTCLDGWPIRILQDPQCPRGVCGYTCAPDRWRAGQSSAAIGSSVSLTGPGHRARRVS